MQQEKIERAYHNHNTSSIHNLTHIHDSQYLVTQTYNKSIVSTRGIHGWTAAAIGSTKLLVGNVSLMKMRRTTEQKIQRKTPHLYRPFGLCFTFPNV